MRAHNLTPIWQTPKNSAQDFFERRDFFSKNIRVLVFCSGLEHSANRSRGRRQLFVSEHVFDDCTKVF
jgi:hypothetical protein